MQFLVVTSKFDDDARKEAKAEARRAVAAAEKFELIKPSERELFERQHKISTIKEEN